MTNKLVIPTQKLADGNPFYKMTASLSMLQQCSKMTDNPSKSVVVSYLANAWKECIGDLVKRQMFFSVVFSFGDINNREHNIFRSKGIKNIDQGGTSLRKVFLYCLEWIHNNVSEQFYNFLPVFGEYYNLGANTMYHILWTDRFKGTIKEVYRVNVDVDRLTTYIHSMLSNPKTSDNELKLWAKWLWRVPTPGRTRKFVVTEKGLKSIKKNYGPDHITGDVIRRVGDKQEATKQKDKHVLGCIDMLSKKMEWKIIQHPTNIEYVGYREFRTKYLSESEAYLFATQKIKEYDKVQLLDWFETLPSGARYNVQRRLLNLDKSTKKLVNKGKWMSNNGEDIGKLYMSWLTNKEVAQQALRNLSTEEKVKLAKEQPDILKTMEKAAKVNTGASTLLDNVAELFAGGDAKGIDLACQSIMDKVKIDVPVLLCIDTSGSMASKSLRHKSIAFSAIDMARLASTIFLLKNPKEELQDMFIDFNTSAKIVTTGISTQVPGKNRLTMATNTIVKWITDSKKSFLENYKNVSSVINTPGGGTTFSNVSVELKKWVDAEPMYSSQRIEAINQYPVFLVISDGD